MRITRTPVQDELLLDGELVVLVDDTVMVLSEVASAALVHLVTGVWTTFDALVGHLRAAVGLSEDGELAVFSLLSALEDAGLVAVDR